MKTHSFKKITGIALLASSALAMSGAAFAATNANTSISNQATVNYKVATVSQTAVNSNAHTFKVDRKVNFTVTRVDTAAIAASPGTATVLTYSITNNSNDVLDFNLAAVAEATNNGTVTVAFGADTIDSDGSVFAYWDTNGNGTWDSGTETSTLADNIAIGATTKAFIVTTFSTASYAAASIANGDIAGYYLTATSATSVDGVNLVDHSGTADDPAVVQNVFADATAGPKDAAYDGTHSAGSEYVISSANLVVTKASVVVSDPITTAQGGSNPKAIPGAIVKYTITIQNTGTADATDIILVDDQLALEITNSDLSFNTDTYAAGSGIQITAPQVTGGAPLNLTNAIDAQTGTVEGQWDSNTLTVSGFTVKTAETATITFEITLTP